MSNRTSKTIFITGASGFIGSFMVEEALLKGYNVWAGIRESSSKEFLQDSRINFVNLNYTNVEALSKQLSGIDYIIHCAGITKSIKKDDFHKINYQYSANLIEAIKRQEHQLTKFIQMSSLSVMGMGDENGFTPFESTSAARPNTLYGKSKLEFEQYLENCKDIPYIIMRPTGVYGPREKDYFMMLKSIKMGINAKVGFAPQHLTFIYIQDLVDVTFLALESPIINKKYFITDGCNYTDKGYTKTIKHLLNKQRTINITVPLFLLKVICYTNHLLAQVTQKPSTLNMDKYKIMQQRNWKCKIDDVISDLNFQPKHNLHQGLAKSIEWYTTNGWL